MEGIAFRGLFRNHLPQLGIGHTLPALCILQIVFKEINQSFIPTGKFSPTGKLIQLYDQHLAGCQVSGLNANPALPQ